MGMKEVSVPLLLFRGILVELHLEEARRTQ